MKTMALLALIALSWNAIALPENGVIKELGEASISDAVTPPPENKNSAGVGNFTPIESASVYGQLDPFNEVAILQRKFLPKRHRFEVGVEYGSLLDNAFYDTQGFYGRLAYSFTETLALEVLGFSLSTKQSRATDSLFQNGGVASNASAEPKSYIGADVKWSPIYGKIAFWNSTVIPVEQFFLLGAGSMGVTGASSTTAFHAGTGFSFGIAKWLATRVGIDFFNYNVSGAGDFTDTHLSFGFSAFFPGATYR